MGNLRERLDELISTIRYHLREHEHRYAKAAELKTFRRWASGPAKLNHSPEGPSLIQPPLVLKPRTIGARFEQA